ncbi:MAG: UbiA prenyltransferase family protein, partial [Deltaproteobacteria bacterium]
VGVRLARIVATVAAFFVFSTLAGAIYIINDLVDADADRRHPTKKHRPIAAGIVSPGVARMVSIVLVVGSLGCATALSLGVGLCALAYLLNNLAYSLRIKHVPYLDVGSIALGFVLRVLAGSYAVSVPASFYIIALTALLALFLGFGKRRHELKVNQAKARAALEAYSPRALTAALYICGTLALAGYAMYTLDPTTVAFFRTRYLWVTTPFVAIEFAIFVGLVRDESRLDSPTDEILKNVPFILVFVLWAIVILTLVYKLRPSA